MLLSIYIQKKSVKYVKNKSTRDNIIFNTY